MAMRRNQRQVFEDFTDQQQLKSEAFFFWNGENQLFLDQKNHMQDFRRSVALIGEKEIFFFTIHQLGEIEMSVLSFGFDSRRMTSCCFFVAPYVSFTFSGSPFFPYYS